MLKRLDVLMKEKELVQSRERAKSLIAKAQVLVNDKVALKAGQAVSETDDIKIIGEINPFVSRGGLKLKKAVSAFCLDLKGKTCIDIGASTGGFTQCMLNCGAEKVFAVDVGEGQLHASLLKDERVINLEKTNIRFLDPERVEKADFISIDVSFISLKIVLPAAKAFLKEKGEMVALIKPQFEAGKGNVGKKGVVKDRKIHFSVIEETLAFAASVELYPKALDFSPIKGPEGNIEYLVLLSRTPTDFSPDIKKIVDESHLSL